MPSAAAPAAALREGEEERRVGWGGGENPRRGFAGGGGEDSEAWSGRIEKKVVRSGEEGSAPLSGSLAALREGESNQPARLLQISDLVNARKVTISQILNMLGCIVHHFHPFKKNYFLHTQFVLNYK